MATRTRSKEPRDGIVTPFVLTAKRRPSVESDARRLEEGVAAALETRARYAAVSASHLCLIARRAFCTLITAVALMGTVGSAHASTEDEVRAVFDRFAQVRNAHGASASVLPESDSRQVERQLSGDEHLSDSGARAVSSKSQEGKPSRRIRSSGGLDLCTALPAASHLPAVAATFTKKS